MKTVCFPIAVLVGLLGGACDPEDPVGATEPTAHLPFSDGRHASSARSGDLIQTELHDRAHVALATAEWSVAERKGTVTLRDLATSVPVQPDPDTALDFASANQMTHAVWTMLDGKTRSSAYDLGCTTVYLGECGCCSYESCTFCDWEDQPRWSGTNWTYKCYVGSSPTTCDPNCRCADDLDCGCSGTCGGSCCE